MPPKTRAAGARQEPKGIDPAQVLDVDLLVRIVSTYAAMINADLVGLSSLSKAWSIGVSTFTNDIPGLTLAPDVVRRIKSGASSLNIKFLFADFHREAEREMGEFEFVDYVAGVDTEDSQGRPLMGKVYRAMLMAWKKEHGEDGMETDTNAAVEALFTAVASAYKKFLAVKAIERLEPCSYIPARGQLDAFKKMSIWSEKCMASHIIDVRQAVL
jgi:hypothetical protein